MRILVIHDDSRESGGANVYRREFSDVLRKRKVKIFLFTFNMGPDEDLEHSCHYRFGKNIKFFRHLSHNYFNPALFLALRKYIQRVKPDIIHIHHNNFFTNTVLFALNKQIPVFQTIHDYHMICPTYKGYTSNGNRCENKFGVTCYQCGCLTLRDYLLACIPRHFTKFLVNQKGVTLLVPSEHLKDKLKAYGLDATLLRHYIDTSLYDTDQSYPSGNRILFVGRLIEDKGVGILLQAFRQVVATIPSAKLDLAGNGAARSKFLKLAKSMQLDEKAVFHGLIPHSKIPELYKNSSLVVLPATSFENSPLAILEAMAAGRPVIGSRIGGIPELVIDGRNGYLCTPGDPIELGDKILQLLLNKDFGQRMGAHGKIMAKSHYSIEKHLQNYFQLVNKTLSSIKAKNQKTH